MPAVLSTGRAAALLVLGAACASPRPLPMRGDWVFEVAHAREVDAAFAAAGTRILAGFPHEIATDSFRAGDRLLFGFESFDDDRVTRFYVELRCVAPGETVRDLVLDTRRELKQTVPTRDATVVVRVLDESFAVVDERESEVATAVHEIGLYGYAWNESAPHRDPPPLWDGPRSRPPDELRDKRFAWSVTLELLAGFSRNAALADRLRALSVWPGLFRQLSILFSRLILDSRVDQARIVPSPIPDLSERLCLEVELILIQDHDPLLVAFANVVPPVGPLALSAGIVTIAGYRGDDPRKRFVARLLAMEQAGAQTR